MGCLESHERPDGAFAKSGEDLIVAGRILRHGHADPIGGGVDYRPRSCLVWSQTADGIPFCAGHVFVGIWQVSFVSV